MNPMLLRMLAAVLILAAAGCGSTPTIHYYTLLAPAADIATPAATAAPGGPLAFELLPVSVPPQVDVQQIVVRRGGDTLVLLENERWIAPVADELRSALSSELSRRLGAPDIAGLARPAGAAVLRIKVDLRRFDSEPGRHAVLEAVWTLRAIDGREDSASLCTTRVREAVPPTVAEGGEIGALVLAHQRALAALAAQIAEAAGNRLRGRPGCPQPA